MLKKLALLLAITGAAHATEAYLVNRASDLHFVPLKEAFTQVRSRFEGNVDLLDRVRRQAFKRLSDEWGIPPADSKNVELGCVARTDAAGDLSFAVVVRGEIDPAKIQKKLLAINASEAAKRGAQTDQKPVTVQGKAGTKWPYFERQMEYTTIPLDKTFVLYSAPKGNTALLEEVLTALQNPDQLGKADPPVVVVEAKLRPTEQERKRLGEFRKRQVGGAVAKVRDKFRQLHDSLRPGGAKDEDLKSLDERLNEQFLKSTEYTLKTSWQPGDDYRGKYVLRFPTDEDAQKMKELVLEKILFFRENARSDGIPRALDTVTVLAQGPELTVRVQLDTPEKRYDAAFSYVAFLLSFSGADRDLGITRGD